MVFTGIVQGTAEVTDVESTDKFSQIKIKFPPNKVDTVKVGASVAVNGTCLTVTDVQRDQLSFDIMMETLRTTNLGELGAGSVVNFERAAKLGDEIGGHAVSGHVHSTGTITQIEQLPNSRRVTITLSDPRWVKYILPKGFIAVDGTSLTVGEVNDNSFTIYLIPETLRVTVFGIKSVGDSVNIEVESQTQAIVDTVERVIAQYFERLGVGAQLAQAAASGAAAAANGAAGAGAGNGGSNGAASQQQLAAAKAQQELQQKQQELEQQRLKVQRQLEELQLEQQRLQQEMQNAAAVAAAAAAATAGAAAVAAAPVEAAPAPAQPQQVAVAEQQPVAAEQAPAPVAAEAPQQVEAVQEAQPAAAPVEEAAPAAVPAPQQPAQQTQVPASGTGS